MLGGEHNNKCHYNVLNKDAEYDMTDNNKLPLIIEPDALHTILTSKEHFLLKQELIIVDFCNLQLYRQAHVPGAIHVQSHLLVAGALPARGKLPSLAQLESLFSELGFTGNEHFVVYDDEGGGWAGRFIWTLDVIGHQKYSYLNGGIHAWLKEGYPRESMVNKRVAAEVSLAINGSHMASTDFILDTLDDSRFIIWDARSPEEFSGEKILAKKGGHIPGAINFEWTKAMDPEKTTELRTG